MKKTIDVFAPANIALIKYMGKDEGRPSNSSLSLTLSRLGTRARLTEDPRLSAGELVFEAGGYLPPEKGVEKLRQFLFLPDWGQVDFGFQVFTENTIPAGTGIASSASSFCAFGVARSFFSTRRFSDLELCRMISKGSGSAGRSLMGPLVEWTPNQDFHSYDIPFRLYDYVLILDREPKSVSSSEAHLRVRTSPEFVKRKEKVIERLAFVKKKLQMNEWDPSLRECVYEEAVEMHCLFETSDPPFSYRSKLSNAYEGALMESGLGLVTMDAGQNIHWILRQEDLAKADLALLKIFQAFGSVEVLKDEIGPGVIR